jgi:hypothetical protein
MVAPDISRDGRQVMDTGELHDRRELVCRGMRSSGSRPAFGLATHRQTGKG